MSFPLLHRTEFRLQYVEEIGVSSMSVLTALQESAIACLNSSCSHQRTVTLDDLENEAPAAPMQSDRLGAQDMVSGLKKYASVRTPSKMLKLTLTDGKKQWTAIEYRKISKLHLFLPLGSKVILKDTQIAPNGLLLLENQSQVQLIMAQLPDRYPSDIYFAQNFELTRILHVERELLKKLGKPLDDRKTVYFCVSNGPNSTQATVSAETRTQPTRGSSPIVISDDDDDFNTIKGTRNPWVLAGKGKDAQENVETEFDAPVNDSLLANLDADLLANV